MKKIGIIGAMEKEVDTLKSKLDNVQVITKAKMDFYAGQLHGTDVVVVRSGVGKVNAALCVQILADLFEVTHVINTGIAGSLNAELNIGDILISADAIQHDFDVRIFGYALGELASMGIREFQADKAMAKLALETCAEVNPDIRAQLGRVVSGDQFICDKAVKENLIREFQADCTEMEGAAIAHGAYLNDIPFLVVRAISDKADGSAEMDYPTFEREAALHSAKLVEALVAKI